MKITFTLKVLLLTLANVAALYLLDLLLPKHTVPLAAYLFTAAFALLTFLLHRWLTGESVQRPQRFVTYFMGAITLKLFATLIFLTIYLVMVGEEKVIVALSAFTTYVLFTVLQVSTLSRK